MVRSAVKSLVKSAAAMADVARRTEGLPVLIYHRVGARTPVSVDLPRALFEEQMAFLAASYRVVTMEEAAQLLVEPEPPAGPPPIVITFDDGTVDFVEEALPVLVEHGIPATMYLATDHLESQIDFPDEGRPMSWAAAADAVSTGLVEIGSHTDTHVLLDRVPPAAAERELDRSIDLIGERLGVEAHHFAYPKALLASPDVEPLVRRRFQTAAVARTRANPFGRSDLHRLTRSPVQSTDGMRWFERKAAGGMAIEDDLRVLVNRWRYRSATE
ncbi:polysaccharide deacetylase family protein [Actinospongicola halichondriae]|uniref:polysaccharide deacetylase family protein n=1 Tax=Actinospongicola halichondriae TaxID=3236844 RepID=UPI003D3C31BF